jgi:hypothetical protein
MNINESKSLSIQEGNMNSIFMMSVAKENNTGFEQELDEI